MKKFLVAVLALICASAIVAQAQGAKPVKHHKLTPGQKTLMKEMIAKYDTNKDGKLEKSERAAMSQEDKDKMAKAGLGSKKRGKHKQEAAPATDPK